MTAADDQHLLWAHELLWASLVGDHGRVDDVVAEIRECGEDWSEIFRAAVGAMSWVVRGQR